MLPFTNVPVTVTSVPSAGSSASPSIYIFIPNLLPEPESSMIDGIITPSEKIPSIVATVPSAMSKFCALLARSFNVSKSPYSITIVSPAGCEGAAVSGAPVSGAVQ